MFSVHARSWCGGLTEGYSILVQMRAKLILAPLAIPIISMWYWMSSFLVGHQYGLISVICWNICKSKWLPPPLWKLSWNVIQADFIKNLEVEVMVSIASSLASNSSSKLPATYGGSLDFLLESLPSFLLVFISILTCLFFLTLRICAATKNDWVLYLLYNFGALQRRGLTALTQSPSVLKLLK